MDTSWLALQVERVERNVAFLRQDQLALLEGLHLEILSLQKRCTELTCELELQPPRRTLAEVEAEEEFLIGRCEEVEMRLEEEQWTVGELQQELSQKGELVRALRCSLRDEERRFLQELKLRSHRSAELHSQLRIQTEAAAYLAVQLHSARNHLHHQHLQWPPPAPPADQPVTSPTVQATPAAPPPDPRHALRAERARECVPRERVTAPEDPTPMPDPALFLHPGRSRPRPLAEQMEGQRGSQEEEEEGMMDELCSGYQINTPHMTKAQRPGSQNYANESSPGDLDRTPEL